MATLEIGTGFKNNETSAFCNDLIEKGVLKEFGRMINGVVIRFDNSDEEHYITNWTVDQVKELLTKNGISF